MKMIFIRHGDPDYINDTVTERGRIEADALVERVSKWDVDKFFCSPLGRAKATAKPSLDYIGRTAEIRDWLREFYVNIEDPENGGKLVIPWDFMPSYWTKQELLYDKDRWYEAPAMRTGPVEEEYKRVCRGLDELLAEYGYFRDGRIYRTECGNEKTLVFFCHLGVQFVIQSYLFGVSAPVLWHDFFVAPASVTVVVTEERKKGEVLFRCKRLGDVSHLYKAGIEPSDSGFFSEVFR